MTTPAYEAGRNARIAYHNGVNTNTHTDNDANKQMHVSTTNPYKDGTKETAEWKQGWDSVTNSVMPTTPGIEPAPPQYNEGKTARQNGAPLTNNPHRHATVEHNQWRDGWNDANHTPRSGLPPVSNTTQTQPKRSINAKE